MVKRAAVITPFFVDHDAVCNDVFHGAAALRRHGWDARIFAVGGESAREKAEPFGNLAAYLREPQDLAYFHFSTGRRELTEVLERLRCRKVLKFHNITPPELFSMWSDELAEASRLGRAEMARIAALDWEAALADSSFNLAQIDAALRPGVRRAVVPPFHESDELLALRPAAARPPGLPRVLAVGRIAPSKGHPFLLRALRYLVHDLRAPAILDIVGKPDHRLLGYLRNLELMVREYGLQDHVAFHGELAPAALAACYAGALLFVSASEHEGFCVPLVEAMAFGVPSVALATSAIPETLGDAGVAWEERDPRRFALTLQRLLAREDERQWLSRLARERYESRFTNAAIEARLVAALAGG